MNMETLNDMVRETREIVERNGATELAQLITVESVLDGVRMMNEDDDGRNWTVEDELQDLIWESWGEDN